MGDSMLNHSYSIAEYQSTLKSVRTTLIITYICLTLLFIGIIVYLVKKIKTDFEKTNKKKNKKKNIPLSLAYCLLIGLIVFFVLISTSLLRQIADYSQDISEEAYVQYEGAANIKKDTIISGGVGRLPSYSVNYIISFEQNGEPIELVSDKYCNQTGDIKKIYIVYTKHSKHILEFKIVE